MTAPPHGAPPGHKLFLDANVLFSAAYRADSGLRVLWELRETTTLLTISYAVEEARRNLPDDAARTRLDDLIAGVTLVTDVFAGELPDNVRLPEKDRPILLSATAANATHLITGDRAHFGPYYGKRLAGILVERPADYVRRARAT